MTLNQFVFIVYEDDDKETLCIVASASRVLNDSESKYILAVYYFITEKWRHYLLGRHFIFL